MNRTILIPAAIAGVVAIGAVAYLIQDRRQDGEGGRPAASSTDMVVQPSLPSFDVVRVEPGGNAVIAGRAAPGAKVSILDGDRVLGTVTADGRGEWVFLPGEALPPGSRQLRLEAVGPDGAVLASAGTVVLAVPEPNRDLAGRRQDGNGEALAVLTGPDGGSRVLQAPRSSGANGAPRPAGEVGIDAIDYDRGGKVTVGGVAKPDAEIMLYVENSLIGRTKAGGDGRWSLTPDRGLENGRYDLRADQLGADGKVVSRVEVEFDKKPIPDQSLAERAVVVLPGNNLWSIARRSYGEGVQYTVIYEANQRQIRDPDLIYPGQIFMMPQGG